jgi:hypothetical protein
MPVAETVPPCGLPPCVAPHTVVQFVDGDPDAYQQYVLSQPLQPKSVAVNLTVSVCSVSSPDVGAVNANPKALVPVVGTRPLPAANNEVAVVPIVVSPVLCLSIRTYVFAAAALPMVHAEVGAIVYACIVTLSQVDPLFVTVHVVGEPVEVAVHPEQMVPIVQVLPVRVKSAAIQGLTLYTTPQVTIISIIRIRSFLFI